jgi:superfamily II DNA or RNA helicase
MEEPVIVNISPDRRNIFLACERRMPSTGGAYVAEDSIEEILKSILVHLCSESRPRIVVFSSLKWCGFIADFMRANLELAGYSPELLAQYHAPQDSAEKERISKDLLNRDGKIRCVVATQALSMGIDIPNAREIHFVGCPKSMEEFTQALGRVGRDGLEARCIVHYNQTDLSNKHLDQEMKNYILTEGCRRRHHLNYFGHVLSEPCDACDNCSRTSPPRRLQSRGRRFRRTTLVSLMKYFDTVNSSVGGVLPQCKTLLSEGLAKRLASAGELSLSDIQTQFPKLDPIYMREIAKIMNPTSRCSERDENSLHESDSNSDNDEDYENSMVNDDGDIPNNDESDCDYGFDINIDDDMNL